VAVCPGGEAGAESVEFVLVSASLCLSLTHSASGTDPGWLPRWRADRAGEHVPVLRCHRGFLVGEGSHDQLAFYTDTTKLVSEQIFIYLPSFVKPGALVQLP
jgi:hypothetical protein